MAIQQWYMVIKYIYGVVGMTGLLVQLYFVLIQFGIAGQHLKPLEISHQLEMVIQPVYGRTL